MFGFTKKKDLDELLKPFYEILEKLDVVADLKNHLGWQKLSGEMVRIAEYIDNEIIKMSAEPKKNAHKLILYRAKRDAIYEFVSIVDNSVKKSKLLNKNIQDYLDYLEQSVKLGAPVSKGEND